MVSFRNTLSYIAQKSCCLRNPKWFSESFSARMVAFNCPIAYAGKFLSLTIIFDMMFLLLCLATVEFKIISLYPRVDITELRNGALFMQLLHVF